jgi:hypothetical protein
MDGKLFDREDLDDEEKALFDQMVAGTLCHGFYTLHVSESPSVTKSHSQSLLPS